MRFLLVKSHPGQNWVALLLQYRQWTLCRNKNRVVRFCLRYQRKAWCRAVWWGVRINLSRQWRRSKTCL